MSVLALLRFASWLNVVGLLVLIVAAAAAGAAVPGARGSAWTRPVPPAQLRRRRWQALLAMAAGAALLAW